MPLGFEPPSKGVLVQLWLEGGKINCAEAMPDAPQELQVAAVQAVMKWRFRRDDKHFVLTAKGVVEVQFRQKIE